MVIFSNCKINLGLNIISKRLDGYHDLETVFYPLPLYDVIEIAEQNEIENQSLQNQSPIIFTDSGLNFKVDEKHNLCFKAYYLLKKDFPNLPAVKIHLHKTIPMGAGLGGGSANAAFTLQLLNTKFQLDLSTKQLRDYTLQLGSDCPFFIINKPCFAEGRGEILNETKLDLSCYKFLIVNPNVHVNTAWAFSKILPKKPSEKITAIIQQPVETWKGFLENDFENPVMEQYPFFKNIKTQLYESGAAYASMSGSGSTFFGIYKSEKDISALQFDKNFLVKEINI